MLSRNRTSARTPALFVTTVTTVTTVTAATTITAVAAAGLWSLSGPSELEACASEEEREAAEAMARARERPADFVMKPQREGGGNNYFGDELKGALETFSRAQRSAYIVRALAFEHGGHSTRCACHRAPGRTQTLAIAHQPKRMTSPRFFSCCQLMQRIFPKRETSVLVRGGAPIVGPAVSELGVYSSLLVSNAGRVLLNQPTGHLVRTKLDGVDEGGVAAGFAVLSSPLLTSSKWK